MVPPGDDPAALRRWMLSALGDVRTLGTLYEQSLEPGRRRATGAYYTPRPLVEYTVAATLGPLVAGRTAAQILALRVLDPAMGAGHFLLAAVDYLARAYGQALLGAGADAAPHRRLVAERCVYGIDLDERAVELARLALWLHAEVPEPRSLRDHLRCGDALLGAGLGGGFDAVLGNPPWVRQETLAADKARLAALYPEVFDSGADLSVLFVAAGLRALRRAGMFGMILPNKWMRAGYGAALRRHLRQEARPLTVVDFGHAPLFPDADTFPCVLIAERQRGAAGALRFCAVDRAALPGVDLGAYVREREHAVAPELLRDQGWLMLPPELARVLKKIEKAGRPLREVLGQRPRCGIKASLSEAFLIDQAARDALVAQDPGCAAVLRRFLRGRDVARWRPRWEGEWMVALRSSENHAWPWAQAGEGAEAIFQATYPALHAHMKRHEAALRRRQDQGRHWWELRSCGYYDLMERPKLVYQEIQFRSAFAFDAEGYYLNNKAFFVPTDDLGVIAVLNSSLLWWYLWVTAPHMKDEALALQGFSVEALPVVQAPREGAAELLRLQGALRAEADQLLGWLQAQHGLGAVPPRLQAFWTLDEAAFLKELKKARIACSPAALAQVRAERAGAVERITAIERAARRLEQEGHALVYRLYGLTRREIELLRAHAPPRDPQAG